MTTACFEQGQAVWCMKSNEGYNQWPPWPAKVHSTTSDETNIVIHFFNDVSEETVHATELKPFLPYLASFRTPTCFEKHRRKWETAIMEGIEHAVQISKVPKAQAALSGFRQRNLLKKIAKLEILLPSLLDFTQLSSEAAAGISKYQGVQRRLTTVGSSPLLLLPSFALLCIASHSPPPAVYQLCLTSNVFHRTLPSDEFSTPMQEWDTRPE
jgi:hypothetical protein